ncbi:hypothetical protein HanXRQr2_Chr01g0005831 [Helianthus annuus]|uniref:Uncharacterized protein n=1 Tax=Helianthus annuus TaxID=4232 RepID=A0A251VM61_HELAN|nr:hypothetical protein HanXRQr2_Chr01g0005831 [Helianthus annuus]
MLYNVYHKGFSCVAAPKREGFYIYTHMAYIRIFNFLVLNYVLSLYCRLRWNARGTH